MPACTIKYYEKIFVIKVGIVCLLLIQPKDEGWFMILGDTEYRDVIALKRLGGVKRKTQQQLLITTPNVEGTRGLVIFKHIQCCIT